MPRLVPFRSGFYHCPPLGPLPWSLATVDGLPRKAAKSTLSRELQKNVQHPNSFLCHASACIIDGMAIVHKIKGEKKTFGEIASLILLKAVHEASNNTRVDIVFDVYYKNSIKMLNDTCICGNQHLVV